MLADSLDALDPRGPVVVYCAGGSRSPVAASVLLDAGFSDVSDLLGGYGAWEAAGLPTSTGSDTAAVGSTPQVSARAAKARIDDGALLLDVREPDEWQVQHAPDARADADGTGSQTSGRAPARSPDRGRVPLGRPVRGGHRSLRAWGFDAVNLAGGMCAWSAAGLPVVSDDGGLVMHRAEPLNCETSIPALIGGVVMPNARFYVRNHFPTPALDSATWRLEVGGLVERPLELSLRDLQNMPSHTLVATLECAGNGRSMFDPPTDGEQWRLGAASTAEWTGVPLVEVLDRAVPTASASSVVLRGADSGRVEAGHDPIRFERSLALDDARRSEALLAYAMNGEPLPLQHGYPLRVIVPGWYAVTSVKWLTEIELIDSEFDGFFQVDRYVFEWERDGETVLEPVRLQQVRSVITEPTGGADGRRSATSLSVAWRGRAPPRSPASTCRSATAPGSRRAWSASGTGTAGSGGSC